MPPRKTRARTTRASKDVVVRNANTGLLDLPFEICCLISASLSNEDIRCVVLVCRRARDVFIPILYRLVTVGRSLSALQALRGKPSLASAVRELQVTWHVPRSYWGMDAQLQESLEQQNTEDAAVARHALQLLGESNSNLLSLNWSSNLLHGELGGLITQPQCFGALTKLTVRLNHEEGKGIQDYGFLAIRTIIHLVFSEKLGSRDFIESQPRISEALARIDKGSRLEQLEFSIAGCGSLWSDDSKKFFDACDALASSFNQLRLPRLHVLALHMNPGEIDFNPFFAAHPQLTDVSFDFNESTLQDASLPLLDTYMGPPEDLVTILNAGRPIKCLKVHFPVWECLPEYGWINPENEQDVLKGLKNTPSLQRLSMYPSSDFGGTFASWPYSWSTVPLEQVEDIASACPNLTFLELCVLDDDVEAILPILARLSKLVHIFIHLDQYRKRKLPDLPEDGILHWIESHLHPLKRLEQVTLHVRGFKTRFKRSQRHEDGRADYEKTYDIGIIRKKKGIKAQCTT